jgi:hypothetical protein
VLNIDREKMIVNDWNNGNSQRLRPDGKTVYYIATYATPKTPADMIGEPYVQSDEKLIGMPVVVNLFQFTNGINGSRLLEMCIL